MSGFEGRRVVVTGCASGIGEALARILVARGAEVVGLDRQDPEVPVAEFHHVDLADSDSIAETAVAIGDPVDVLFNVAGISGTIGARTIVGVNFVGTRELTDALLPAMGAGSAIVTTASIAASRHRARRDLVEELLATRSREEALDWVAAHADEVGTGYAISKDAIVWWTLHRAVDLAPAGIRVNCVAPGTTATPIIEATRAARGDAFLEAIPMPLGRMADPREQAEVLAFLGGPGASYVSGQVVWVDGGYMAGVATGAIEDVTGSVGTAAGG
jgi:NAD(P)-dependent dehydrogenase (short-subunit alcohol dehydrogenase family)